MQKYAAMAMTRGISRRSKSFTCQSSLVPTTSTVKLLCFGQPRHYCERIARACAEAANFPMIVKYSMTPGSANQPLPPDSQRTEPVERTLSHYGN